MTGNPAHWVTLAPNKELLSHSPKLCFTTHPCRRRSADRRVSGSPSEFYATPSNPYVRCRHPTAWTSPCRSPSLGPRRNGRVAPEGGVWSTPPDSDCQNGICSLRWWTRRKNIGYSIRKKVTSTYLLNGSFGFQIWCCITLGFVLFDHGPINE